MSQWCLDDRDKSTSQRSVGYLYDLLDLRMALIGGRHGPVSLVLNHLPQEFGEQLARHGHLGVATAQRGLQRDRPALVDFSALPVWEERPGFQRERGTGFRREYAICSLDDLVLLRMILMLPAAPRSRLTAFDATSLPSLAAPELDTGTERRFARPLPSCRSDSAPSTTRGNVAPGSRSRLDQ